MINAATFRKAFAEWCYCQFEVDSLHEQDWKKCPPCSIDQHSCHVDGNQKVYRFKKVSRYMYVLTGKSNIMIVRLLVYSITKP